MDTRFILIDMLLDHALSSVCLCVCVCSSKLEYVKAYVVLHDLLFCILLSVEKIAIM